MSTVNFSKFWINMTLNLYLKSNQKFGFIVLYPRPEFDFNKFIFTTFRKCFAYKITIQKRHLSAIMNFESFWTLFERSVMFMNGQNLKILFDEIYWFWIFLKLLISRNGVLSINKKLINDPIMTSSKLENKVEY